MDQQIQLHQDMLFQNNYLLQRTVSEPKDSRPFSIGDLIHKDGNDIVGITSSEDDSERIRRTTRKRRAPESSPVQLISSVLSAQNVLF